MQVLEGRLAAADVSHHGDRVGIDEQGNLGRRFPARDQAQARRVAQGNLGTLDCRHQPQGTRPLRGQERPLHPKQLRQPFVLGDLQIRPRRR